MARKTITQLVDDLDDTPIVDGEGQTVRFALDGTSYELDLTNGNAAEMRKALASYVDAARKVSGGRQSGAGTSGTRRPKTDVDPRAVREWAKSNKVEVSPRGRIPQGVIDQFRAAGN